MVGNQKPEIRSETQPICCSGSVRGTCFPLNAHTGAQGNVQVIHQVPLERGDAGSLLSLCVSICP